MILHIENPEDSTKNLLNVIVCAQSLQSCPTLCNPMDFSLPGSSVVGFSRQEYWSGLLCPSPGDLPNPGIKLTSLMSPTLADVFSITSATWEAQLNVINKFITVEG